MFQRLISSVFPDYGELGNTTHCRGLPYQQVRCSNVRQFELEKISLSSTTASLYVPMQIFTHFPQAKRFYSEFEQGYDANPVLNYLQKWKYIAPPIVVLIYGTGCYLGQKYMKDRASSDISFVLSVWNALLAGFSLYGAIRTVPHLLYRIGTLTFEETICEDPCTAFGSGAVGLATQLFILSKVPELFDTAFLILKKKPVTFLHWYHHITVLLYCWNSYITESSTGLYFVAMNYTVHAVMYFYYCLQTLHLLPRSFPAHMITILQIMQMFVGALVVLSSAIFYVFGGSAYPPGTCNDHPVNIISGGLMYGSYLYLFIKFALRRYFRRNLENADKKQH